MQYTWWTHFSCYCTPFWLWIITFHSSNTQVVSQKLTWVELHKCFPDAGKCIAEPKYSKKFLRNSGLQIMQRERGENSCGRCPRCLKPVQTEELPLFHLFFYLFHLCDRSMLCQCDRGTLGFLIRLFVSQRRIWKWKNNTNRPKISSRQEKLLREPLFLWSALIWAKRTQADACV